ncbi:MAG: ABC transporter ATP-binding protein [Gemmatimonadota bacterium]
MNTTATQSTLKQIALLVPASERMRLFVVLVSAIVVALFEALGVASIVPFMAVLMEPESIARYALLTRFTELFDAQSIQDQLVVLGAFTAATVIASNAATAAGLYVQQKFVARTRVRLTTSLFDTYLQQPLSFHAARDSASLLKVIFVDAEAAARLIGSAIQLVARGLVIVALVALLLLQNPTVALYTFGGMGGCYVAIYLLIRRRQEKLGAFVSVAATNRHRASQEGLGGVKDLLILGREQQVQSRFRSASRDVCAAQVSNVLTSSLPRFFLEPVAFGGIVIVALYMVLQDGGNASTAIPTLALYALVGYRLLPALQQVFTAAVDIQYTAPSLHALEADWRTVVTLAERKRSEDREVESARSIVSLRDVSFTYPGAAKPALAHVSLTIEPGESIGLVGRTGSGKTTLADIILGLHEPSSGTISIGATKLDARSVRSWRRHVGYVPQQVYLANATVTENIAFGLPTAEIDHEAVRRAARMAQAEGFVLELSSGFDTVVGERGVMLSGGQRQRLGIARALYHDPHLLVFDEATSALDGMTEDAVMDALHALSGSRTVILIAHRLRTVEACNRIVLMERGQVVAVGPYEQLLMESTEFRQMHGHTANAVMSGEAALG